LMFGYLLKILDHLWTGSVDSASLLCWRCSRCNFFYCVRLWRDRSKLSLCYVIRRN
jgi:hypothetical protein